MAKHKEDYTPGQVFGDHMINDGFHALGQMVTYAKDASNPTEVSILGRYGLTIESPKPLKDEALLDWNIRTTGAKTTHRTGGFLGFFRTEVTSTDLSNNDTDLLNRLMDEDAKTGKYTIIKDLRPKYQIT